MVGAGLGWPWGRPQDSDGLCSLGLFTGGGALSMGQH